MPRLSFKKIKNLPILFLIPLSYGFQPTLLNTGIVGKWNLREVSFRGINYNIDSILQEKEPFELILYFGYSDKNECYFQGDLINYFNNVQDKEKIISEIATNQGSIPFNLMENTINFSNEKYTCYHTVLFSSIRELNGDFELNISPNELLLKKNSLKYVYERDSTFDKTVVPIIKHVKEEMNQEITGIWNLIKLTINDSMYNYLKEKIDVDMNLELRISKSLTGKSETPELNNQTFLKQLQTVLDSGGWQVTIYKEFIDELYVKEHNYGYRIGYNDDCNSFSGYLQTNDYQLKYKGGKSTLIACFPNFKGEILNSSAFNGSYKLIGDTLIICNPIGSVYFFLKK